MKSSFRSHSNGSFDTLGIPISSKQHHWNGWRWKKIASIARWWILKRKPNEFCWKCFLLARPPTLNLALSLSLCRLGRHFALHDSLVHQPLFPWWWNTQVHAHIHNTTIGLRWNRWIIYYFVICKGFMNIRILNNFTYCHCRMQHTNMCTHARGLELWFPCYQNHTHTNKKNDDTSSQNDTKQSITNLSISVHCANTHARTQTAPTH